MGSAVVIFAVIGAVLCKEATTLKFTYTTAAQQSTTTTNGGKPHNGVGRSSPAGNGGETSTVPSGWQAGTCGIGGAHGMGGCGSGGSGRVLYPHGRLAPPPPYLRNVTGEAKKKFFDIIRNRNLTFAKQKEEFKKWGKTYNVSDQVEEFDRNMTRLKKDFANNVTKLIERLSEAHRNMSAILNNENQTAKEMFDAIRNLTEQSPRLYRVLQFISDQFIKPYGRGRSGFGGPPGFGPSPFGPRNSRGPMEWNKRGFDGFGMWGSNNVGQNGVSAQKHDMRRGRSRDMMKGDLKDTWTQR